MPSPRPPCPVPDPARAPFRVLANAGEAAGRLGAAREDCPYGDDDGRSVPWLDGWWKGRRTRERGSRRPGEPGFGSKTRRPIPPPPSPQCGLEECAEPIVPDPSRTARQNALRRYCCRRHKSLAYFRARVARVRAAAAAGEEGRGTTTMATKRKDPPAVVGTCRLPGCGKPVAWDPSRTARQNQQNHYCCEEHKVEMYRLRRRDRSARERAEVAAGTRPGRPGRPGGRPSGRDVPDRCEAEAAQLNAYWAALGYDIGAEVVEDAEHVEPGGRRRTVRRVKSRLVAGVPKGSSWEEVERRMRARDRSRLPGAAG